MQLNVSSSSGSSAVVQPGGSILIGSDPGCDLVIAGAADRHAFLRMNADGTLTLQDLGSPAGVIVNGQSVAGSVALAGNEQIGIGDSILTLTITVAPAPPATPPQQTPTAPLPPVPAVPTQAAPPPTAPVSPQPARTGFRPWMIVALVAAAVALGVIVALLLTSSGGDDEPSPVAAASPSEEPSEEPSPEPSFEPSPTEEPIGGAQYEGLVDGTYNGKYGFKFKARCQQTGPCPVIGTSGAVYHFKYSPASHTYSAKATDRGKCQGTGPDFPYPIHRSITFRVLQSEEMFGTWQATRLGFTMKSSWPEVSRTTGNTRYFCKAGNSKTSWVGTYLS